MLFRSVSQSRYALRDEMYNEIGKAYEEINTLKQTLRELTTFNHNSEPAKIVVINPALDKLKIELADMIIAAKNKNSSITNNFETHDLKFHLNTEGGLVAIIEKINAIRESEK